MVTTLVKICDQSRDHSIAGEILIQFFWVKIWPLRFDVFYLHKYYHNFGEFPWHHNSIFLKIIGHDHGNTSQQQSWLTETPWEFEPLISSLTTISRIPIQLRNSPAFAFLTLFRLIFGIFSLSTMVMSIFWYSNTWIWSILLLCNS